MKSPLAIATMGPMSCFTCLCWNHYRLLLIYHKTKLMQQKDYCIPVDLSLVYLLAYN